MLGVERLPSGKLVNSSRSGFFQLSFFTAIFDSYVMLCLFTRGYISVLFFFPDENHIGKSPGIFLHNLFHVAAPAAPATTCHNRLQVLDGL